MYFVGRVGRRRVRVAVIVPGQGHEVGDGNFARFAGEGGLEDIGVRDVSLAGLEAGTGGADSEIAAYLLVEDRREDAGGVEAWEATPVYGAVGPDERRRRHIPYQSILVQNGYGFQCDSWVKASLAPGRSRMQRGWEVPTAWN